MNAWPMIERCMLRQERGQESPPPKGAPVCFTYIQEDMIINSSMLAYTTMAVKSMLGASHPLISLKEE